VPRKKGGEGSGLAPKETPEDGEEEGGSCKAMSVKTYIATETTKGVSRLGLELPGPLK
jgi:hypothetical protein